MLDIPSPSPIHNFTGITDNSTTKPPNPHGAVGPTAANNGAMTTLFNRWAVQDKVSGATYTSGGLQGFWPDTSSGGVRTVGETVYYPRVLYDPDPAYGGRWLWVAIQGYANTNSGLLVGVSDGSLPTLSTTKRAWVDADPLNTMWADYPSVGLSRKWIVVQVNLYNISDGVFNRSKVFIFDKAQVYSGNITAYTPVTLEARCGGSSCGATQIPGVTYGNYDDVYLVQMSDAASGQLRLYRVTNPGNDVIPLGTVSGPAWSDGPPGGADFAPQGPSCTGPIQTGDSRIQNVVYRNGRVWATHTVFYPAGGNPTRASVQWWQIDPTGPSVFQRGLVDDPSNLRFYAYPSIAVNKDDHALLGFSSFNGNEAASARYSFRLATDPPGRMRLPAVLKAGTGCYYKTVGTPAKNAWGNYSATVVDPDDTTLWTLQEYTNAANTWGTWWGQFDPTPLASPTTVSIWDASVAEGDTGTKTLDFDISLSEPAPGPVTVEWKTVDDGSAKVADDDYVAVPTTPVSFATFEYLKTVHVTVNGDIKHEQDETLHVTLSNPAGASIASGGGTATGTIINDDAVPRISIGDKSVIEGNAGNSPYTPAQFKVTLSNPSDTGVTVYYNTADGSALSSDNDYVAVVPTQISFQPASGLPPYSTDTTEQTVTINVFGDLGQEPNENFFVDLSSPGPLGQATLLKARGTGWILDDDKADPGVRGLTVVSDTGRNRLQWVNPTGGGTRDIIRVGWDKSVTAGGGCTAPIDPNSPPFFVDLDCSVDIDCSDGNQANHAESPVSNDFAYCYTVWIDYDPSAAFSWSAGTSAKGIPFDSSGRIKWKVFTSEGATGVAPPTVGPDGVLGPSNDHFVYGMERGPTGGTWPSGWKPVDLGGPAQARSPVVPMAGGWWGFFTSQDGWVHAVDTTTGEIQWETQLTPNAGQAAPAGIFAAFGGDWDYLLVGTSDASNPNRFYALNPLTGAVLDWFPQAGELDSLGSPILDLGPVNGMAGVDYQRKKVCFGTIKSMTANPDSRTLWCLTLGPPGNALSFGWGLDQSMVGDFDGSPIIRGTRLYVGNRSGDLWAIDPDDPSTRYSAPSVGYAPPTGDGGVKAFPFPDGSGKLYFSTTHQVHACLDTTAAFDCTSVGWSNDLTPYSPSPVLYSSGKVYVGDDLGQLLELDAAAGTLLTPTLQLDAGSPAGTIGAPSMDAGFIKNIILVGSTNGVFYAVEVP